MKNFLHRLPLDSKYVSSPLRFTYPFCYEPHDLCVSAAESIKDDIRERFPSLTRSGKMFGVLVVRTRDGLFFLKAFSGILEGSYHHEGFVPPVLDLQDENGYFRKEESGISALNERIRLMDDGDVTEIGRLREERKRRSQNLQNWVFEHFEMMNSRGEKKNLLEIFRDRKAPLTEEQYRNKEKSVVGVPPGGAGECCAPKLLQFAYANGYTPVCMAEFWMGASPKDVIRVEGDYYPSCNSKCKPILEHMLEGLSVDENPLIERSRKAAEKVKVLYSDNDVAVIDKPSGLLSVPGKEDGVPSVLSVARTLFPSAEGPIIAHRLDMDTSGVMVLAMNMSAYQSLQKQFVTHVTRKVYHALLEKNAALLDNPVKGTITLPLCPNPFDRPRQMVSYEHGKRATTQYEVLRETNKGVLVEYIPETGRTHQLRVHSAHADGMGSPIVGDILYGHHSDRLYLHAAELSFVHPATGERMCFRSEEDW